VRRIFLLIVLVAASLSSAMERQKGSDYRERRMALAKNLNGGTLILFGGTEPEGQNDLFG